MKKILTLLAVVLVCNVSFAQGVSFEHSSFNEALAKAKKENKLLFMDCFTTWCGPCKWMTKEIFPQEEVGNFFNENFISIKVDMEKGEGIDLNKKYGVQAYPTLLFIDGNGNAVHKLVGGKQAEDLIEGAKSALNPNLRIDVLKEKYIAGNRDYNFLTTYLKALNDQYDKENASIVAKDIIALSSLDKFITKDLFYIIASAQYPYNSKAYNYLLENKLQIKEIAEDYTYNSVLGSPIMAHLKAYVKNCKSLKKLYTEIERCNKQFDISGFGDISKNLTYTFYIENNQLKKWYNGKIEDVEALKGDQKYIYVYNSICDEILRTPKLAAETSIFNDFLKKAQDFSSDKETGIIMGNLMLAKLYLHKKEKENALNAFNVFFEENKKAGGNNTHPSVTNLKRAIETI
ncbi:thioredoxin [Seonamhaeicola algicola]|uniref:Thioredoxin n=1 Tax=Seonamhaeicola algicola TaxID=1719036 RepID=A0A5C7AWN4_9FLAO|nr:thioredoxin domain-containing protein [Seonamhaeicola algicola]TXE13120.1 thioredoxin [Seonamhaeicola algicola]